MSQEKAPDAGREPGLDQDGERPDEPAAPAGYTPEQQERLIARLKALGYL